MSCVNYWNYCRDCEKDNYDSVVIKKCTHCGSENVDACLEWDEEGDHHE